MLNLECKDDKNQVSNKQQREKNIRKHVNFSNIEIKRVKGKES